MKQIANAAALQQLLLDRKRAGYSIALVPTMGYLHEGHLELMRRARKQASLVVVSIFVNPIQFGPNEDLDRYPRDPEGDLEKCRRVGVDLVFTPDPAELYPSGFQTTVRVDKVTRGLCGAGRPEHFEGVATVVAKLFNLTLPDYAFFGEKDYQQLTMIRQMVKDLNFPIRIVGVPIVREPDGLAMSSRNAYLPELERREAPAIHLALQRAVELYRTGERQSRTLLAAATEIMQQSFSVPFTIEYLKICRADNLEEFTDEVTNPAVILTAVHLGTTRLIDNLQLG